MANNTEETQEVAQEQTTPTTPAKAKRKGSRKPKSGGNAKGKKQARGKTGKGKGKGGKGRKPKVASKPRESGMHANVKDRSGLDPEAPAQILLRMPNALVPAFDAWIQEQGFDNRSEWARSVAATHDPKAAKKAGIVFVE